MDRYVSAPVPVYDAPLPRTFRMTLTFVGRGESHVVLNGAQQIDIGLRDGFMDNDSSICLPNGCPAVQTRIESIPYNIGRLLNVGFEACLGAVLLLSLMDLVKLISSKLPSLPRPSSRIMFYWVMCGCCILHLYLAWYFSVSVLGGIPHIPDSAMYYRQAILLLRGQLSAVAPNMEPLLALLSNSSKISGNSILYVHASHFWPAIIAVGLWFGIPALLNPLLGTASLILVMLIARRIYSERTVMIAGGYTPSHRSPSLWPAISCPTLSRNSYS